MMGMSASAQGDNYELRSTATDADQTRCGG